MGKILLVGRKFYGYFEKVENRRFGEDEEGGSERGRERRGNFTRKSRDGLFMVDKKDFW